MCLLLRAAHVSVSICKSPSRVCGALAEAPVRSTPRYSAVCLVSLALYDPRTPHRPVLEDSSANDVLLRQEAPDVAV
jgi:hypothetical protein